MTKRLIVNADDFGYTPGVTAGILRAHQHGVVTSTTIMINMPDAGNALRRVTSEAPRLGVGLHLTLTAGSSISPPNRISSLVHSDGTFKPRAEFLANLCTLRIEEVNTELEAQINRFIDLAGRRPDHLDSHHHAAYMSEDLATTTTDLARRYGIPLRRPLPRSIGSAMSSMLRMGLLLEESSKAQSLLQGITRIFETPQILTPDDLIMDFYGENATLGNLLTLLVELSNGTSELMCHPADVDAKLESMSTYVHHRANELRILTHPSVKEVIQSQAIELITFGDLSRQ